MAHFITKWFDDVITASAQCYVQFMQELFLQCVQLYSSTAMQQFALNALLHESRHAAERQVGVVRFQDDVREMIVLVLYLFGEKAAPRSGIFL